MSAFTRARELLRAVAHRGREERELAEELGFHIDMQAEANVRGGMHPAEARRLALSAFGGVERYKEEVRDARGGGSLERLALDLRYALRGLRRAPGFTAVAVAALALGIGANTAVFTVIDTVILRPLPDPDAERVINLGWDYGKGHRIGFLTPLQFAFWRDHSRVFEGVTTFRVFTAELNGDAEGSLVRGMRVSADFFNVVGTRPVIGRALAPGENEPGGPETAVLSHHFWLDRLGGDSAVLGQTLRLGSESYTIVGVMPPKFAMVGTAESSHDVMVPLQLRVDPNEEGHNFEVIARLRPGIAEAQANADLARVYGEFRADYPALARVGERGVYTTNYEEIYTGAFATTLWILLGATLFVLLIACADVANLLLARSSGRQREIATRSALGAGRWRIVRQLLTESLALGVLGGVAGLLVAVGSLRVLLALTPWSLPRAGEIGLDGRVLGFTLLISVATAAIFGLISALAVTRQDVATALKEGGRGGESAGSRKFREFFVVAETGVSLVLLVGAGLLVASFIQLRRVDLGFDSENVVTAVFDRARDGYDKTAAVWQLERQLLDELGRLPGVEAVAGTSVTPLEGQNNLPVTVEGRPDATEGAVQWRAISPGYFQTMRIARIRGREFTDADASAAPMVAIITRSMAEHYWPGGGALGQRILLGVYEGKLSADHPMEAREIVGIVADTRDRSPDTEPSRTVYIPQAQTPDAWATLPTFIIRGRGTTAVSPAALTRVMLRAAPRLHAPRIRSLSDLMAASLAQERFTMLLMTIFAALALVLTAVGIYGVIAYTVGRRRQEIGVRMALGARRGDVLRMVVGQAMRPVALGLAIGLAAALLLTRVLAGMVYGVSVRDPLTFALVVCVLAAVAVVAAYLPGRRATRVSPVAALRAD